MKDIEVKLDQNICDLKRTDWSIVFAGKFLISSNDKKKHMNLTYCTAHINKMKRISRIVKDILGGVYSLKENEIDNLNHLS